MRTMGWSAIFIMINVLQSRYLTEIEQLYCYVLYVTILEFNVHGCLSLWIQSRGTTNINTCWESRPQRLHLKANQLEIKVPVQLVKERGGKEGERTYITHASHMYCTHMYLELIFYASHYCCSSRKPGQGISIATKYQSAGWFEL